MVELAAVDDRRFSADQSHAVGLYASNTTGANTSTQSITSDPGRENRSSPPGPTRSRSARSRRYQRHVAVGRTGANRHHRLGDPAGDELVAPRRVRPLVQADVALAGLAAVVPRSLARQNLREPMPTIAVGRMHLSY